MTRTCETCRYWSELVAQLERGRLTALCLCKASTGHGRMTSEYAVCPMWAENKYGSVDAPPDDGATARAAYEQEAST